MDEFSTFEEKMFMDISDTWGMEKVMSSDIRNEAHMSQI